MLQQTIAGERGPFGLAGPGPGVAGVFTAEPADGVSGLMGSGGGLILADGAPAAGLAPDTAPTSAPDFASDSAASPSLPRPAPPLVALPVEGQQTTGRLLAALAPMLMAGRRLYCLDGGNVFNPYGLANWARRGAGVDPAALLERVLVSRAYTCHQLLEATGSMLEALCPRAGAGPSDAPGAPAAAGAPPPLAAILGVDRLFLDEDLPMWERRYLFDRILERAERLRRRGLPIVLTFVGGRATPWGRELARRAHVLDDVPRAVRRITERGPHGTHAADL